MLYKIGTLKEAKTMEGKIPDSVFSELIRDVAVLDSDYGEDRNYLESGGYAVIAETGDDVLGLQKIIDYEKHPCEWSAVVESDSGYLAALYLLNDDYAIMLFMPIAVAPDVILNDLEDEKQ